MPGLGRLARAVGLEPEPVRAVFAEAALAEMVASHAEEADRARADARHTTRDRDLARWARAADSYAAELRTLAGSLATAESVEVGIGIGPEKTVYLRIDGRLVMVGSPRVRRQAAFEQRVVERFCSQYYCEDLVADLQPPQPVLQPVAAATRWSFSQHAGPACSTDDGLVFQFQNTSDLERKRRACRRVVAELNALAELIRRETALGTRIDWNRLAIHPTRNDTGHRVTLNGDGDSTTLAAPGLAGADGLFRQLRPWLAARVDGNQYRLVLLNSDRLMAPLLQGAE